MATICMAKSRLAIRQMLNDGIARQITATAKALFSVLSGRCSLHFYYKVT